MIWKAASDASYNTAYLWLPGSTKYILLHKVILSQTNCGSSSASANVTKKKKKDIFFVELPC